MKDFRLIQIWICAPPRHLIHGNSFQRNKLLIGKHLSEFSMVSVSTVALCYFIDCVVINMNNNNKVMVNIGGV